MTIERANTNNPAGILFNKFNDMLAQLRGLFNQARFSKNRIDSIYDDIYLRDHYSIDNELGHNTTTYTDWELFHDSPGYSIWKYPVVSFSDSANNLLTLDDEDLDNRGAASSESYNDFSSVLRYHSETPLVYLSNGTTYTSLTNPITINLGAGYTVYVGLDYPPTGLNFTVSVAGSYTAIAIQYSAALGAGGWGWEDLSYTDTTAGLTTTGEFYWTTPTDFTTGTINSASKYWLKITATAQVTSAVVTLATHYYDDTVEAISEKGTRFPLLKTTTNIRYIGSASTFGGVSFRMHTGGKGYALKVEYYTATGWVTMDDSDDLVDDTGDFVSNGNITFTEPSDWTTVSVDHKTYYWIRITTTATPTAVAFAYKVDIPTSVISLLRLNNNDILLKNWAWCYYNNYVYVTIPNTANGTYEGDKFITGDSTATNLQNFFVYNHEYKLYFLLSNYRDSSCHNICRALNGVTSKFIVINSASTVVSSVDADGNWVLKGTMSSGSNLLSGAGYLDHEVNLLDKNGGGAWYFANSSGTGIWQINSEGDVWLGGTLTESGAPSAGTKDYTVKIPEATGRVMCYNCEGEAVLTIDSDGNGTILGDKSENYDF